MISQKPKYVYGGNDLSKGIDCSRLPHLTATRAGIVGLQRMTAHDIYHAKDGWKSKSVTVNDADSMDLVFWVWTQQKKDALRLSEKLVVIDKKPVSQDKLIDHVGIVLVGKRSGLLEVAHMSRSKGGIIEEFKEALSRDCVGVRRLTIGDK